MKRTLAICWLLLTLVPIVYLVYFMSYVGAMPTHGSFIEQRERFDRLFVLHFATIVCSWLLVASYLVYLFKTSFVPLEKKVLWAVVLFLGNMVAMPIFWFLYVWAPLNRRDSGVVA